MNTLASFLLFFVEITLKATILLGAAWIAGLLMKSCSAALRHTMRAYALIAVLLLPVLSYLMPAWSWQNLPRFLVNSTRVARAGQIPGELPEKSVWSGRNIESVIADIPTSGPITSTPVVSKSQPAVNWPKVLSMLWLAGIVLITLRLVISRSRLARLVRRAAKVDDAQWRIEVREIAVLLGVRRPVALLQSQETEVPLTSGSWRPKIILSPDYLEWSGLRREAILRHELAHIRRWDTLAQAICHLAITMYWFHPLVWLTVRAIREERERACDDYVIAAGTKPSDYAQELLAIASGLRQPDFITALALARRSPLEGRVMALLNPAQRRGSISQSTALIVALLTLGLVLPLAAIQTAEPQPKSAKLQTGAATKPSPGIPSSEEAKPAKPLKPQHAPAVPPPPAGPPAPADGVTGGIAGGVPDGVPGGVTGGVPNVRAIEAVPPAPPAPATPQIAPPLLPPPPVSPKSHALPSPAPLPAPAAIPIPRVAPVAPAAPAIPVAPTVETAPAAPQDEAAKTAALAAVRAKLAAIHAQQDVTQAEIKALKARIAEEVRTSVLSRSSDVVRLRAETQEQAAAMASRVAETAAVRAQVAAMKAATSQVKAAVQKAIEKSVSPASPAPANPASTKP